MDPIAPSTELVDLLTQRIQLGERGTVGAVDRRVVGEHDGEWCLALFDVESSEDVHSDCWEMHPFAEEVVCCLKGGICLVLRSTGSGNSGETVHLRPVQAMIVPRAQWHRLEFEQPAQLLAITVRHGTELEARTAEPRIRT
jgi:hypothetical protein